MVISVSSLRGVGRRGRASARGGRGRCLACQFRRLCARGVRVARRGRMGGCGGHGKTGVTPGQIVKYQRVTSTRALRKERCLVSVVIGRLTFIGGALSLLRRTYHERSHDRRLVIDLANFTLIRGGIERGVQLSIRLLRQLAIGRTILLDLVGRVLMDQASDGRVNGGAALNGVTFTCGGGVQCALDRRVIRVIRQRRAVVVSVRGLLLGPFNDVF